MRTTRKSSLSPLSPAAYSPNGGMAHIYLRNSNAWDVPDSVDSALNQAVADRLACECDNPNSGFHRRFAAVVFRGGGLWGADYRWRRLNVTTNQYESVPLDELAQAHPEWDIVQRIAEIKGSEAGDVLLIMGENDGTRYSAWHWDAAKCKAWHGEPDPDVSHVPLLFAFTGGKTDVVQAAIAEAARVSGRPGDFTNADLTPVILKVLSKTR